MTKNPKHKKFISDDNKLLAEWDWEKNVFSPNIVSYGSAKICYWICSKCGHHWKTPAYSRGSNGCGCPNCAKIIRGISKKKSSTKKNNFVENFPNIAKEWHPYKNTAHDKNNVSAFSNIKAWWLCSKCGNEWITTVSHRTKEENGCPVCSRKRGSIAKTEFHAKTNNFAENHPDIAKEWHLTKNGALSVNSLSVSSNKRVWWKCSFCGNEWQATPNHRFNGRGCPACAGKICATGQNDLLTKNPRVAQEWHYEKNGPITPDSIAVKSNKRVWWICEKGHEWQTTVSERNRGTRSSNCPYCSNKKVLVGYNDLATTHPKLTKEWHYKKNGELKPQMVTAGSSKKVWWFCEKGHEWEAYIYSRKNGSGCPVCYKASKK